MPVMVHCLLVVSCIVVAGLRVMKLGESRKFTFVRSVLFSVCLKIYPLLSAGITVISRLS